VSDARWFTQTLGIEDRSRAVTNEHARVVVERGLDHRAQVRSREKSAQDREIPDGRDVPDVMAIHGKLVSYGVIRVCEPPGLG
jgi:hypothetical protein